MFLFVLHQIGSALFIIGPLLMVWEYIQWRSGRDRKRFLIRGGLCVVLTAVGVFSLKANLQSERADLPSMGWLDNKDHHQRVSVLTD